MYTACMVRGTYKLFQIVVVLGILVSFLWIFFLMFPTASGRVTSLFGFPIMEFLLPIIAIKCALLFLAGRYEKQGNLKMGVFLLTLPVLFVLVGIGLLLHLLGAL